jgi:hypothetical protein
MARGGRKNIPSVNRKILLQNMFMGFKKMIGEGAGLQTPDKTLKILAVLPICSKAIP